MIKRAHILATVSGATLVLALGAAAPPAYAQAGTKSQNADTVETVTVTGYRVKEDIQTVSASVAAISGDQLETKNILQIADLQNATPSLSITDAGLSQNVNIRGIGLASGNPNALPGVPVYIDGLVQPAIGATSGFFDIRDVEVYRGPQGTFAGDNSTGGAVFVTSNSPTLDRFSGDIEAWGGDYWDIGARGAVNAPLTDTLGFRAAFNIETRDSFYKTASSTTPTGVPYNTPGKLDEKDIRLGFLWQPTDNLTILLKLSGGKKSTDGYAARPIPGTPNAAYAPTDVRTLNYDTPEMNDERTLRNSLEINYVLPNGITLRSISGYQENIVKDIYDIDATANPASYNYEAQDVSERPLTQEVDIISPAGERLQWVAGFFYYYDMVKVGLNLNAPAPAGVPITIFTDKESTAGFVNLKYNITNALQVELGGRYTTDTVKSDFIVFGFPNAGSYSDDTWSGKLGLNYTLDDSNFLYGFVARGAKSGGANGASIFKPETVWDYELGWKTQLFDDKVAVQVDGFYNQFLDYQVDAVDQLTGQVGPTNIDNTRIYGLEVQSNGAIGGFRYDLNAAYVVSELGTVTLVNQRAMPQSLINLPACSTLGSPNPGVNCVASFAPWYVTVSGKQNAYAPKLTFSAGVQYTFTLDADTTLTPRVDYSYQARQWASLIEDPTYLIAAHDIWNLRLTLDHNQWSLAAYITNLADKTYVSGQFLNTEYFGPPRQYGARLSYRF